MRLRSAVIALCVALATITSGVATCVVDAADSQQAQTACCKAGHRTCGPHGTPADCCRITPHAVVQLAGTAVSMAAPRLAPTAWEALGLSAPALSGLPRLQGIVGDSSPPGTKHPTYLVLSTLRL